MPRASLCVQHPAKLPYSGCLPGILKPARAMRLQFRKSLPVSTVQKARATVTRPANAVFSVKRSGVERQHPWPERNPNTSECLQRDLPMPDLLHVSPPLN